MSNLRAQIWFGCFWSHVYMNSLLNLPMWLPAYPLLKRVNEPYFALCDLINYKAYN